MKKQKKILNLLLISNLLILGCLNSIFFANAQVSDTEKVPAPRLREHHDYNTSDKNEIKHEYWSLVWRYDDMMMNLIARNATPKNPQGELLPREVDYQQNTQYYVGDIMYIASLAIKSISIIIGTETITMKLTNCESFDLKFSSVQYNDTIPGFNCNITFNQIHLYSDTFPDSTIDLTLIHYVNINWTQSDIKVEALLDFRNTKLYDASDIEFNSNEPFTTEINYDMHLWDWTHGIAISSTSHTDTSLEYNITRESGVPLAVAKLGMKNDFAVYNESGAFDQVGYSSMSIDESSERAYATHGFPNLLYKNTQSIKSDPEINIYHNRVTQNLSLILWISIPTGVIVAVSIVFLIKRKNRVKKANI